MKTESKITNEVLLKKTEAKMAGEIGCLNLLKERTRSSFTTENVFRFKENSQWELETELIKAQKECKGHLKHLLPQVEQEIRESYTEEYFREIEKCFADAPKGLRAEDVEMKGGVLSYTEPYRQARLAVATLELSDAENELYTALCDARSAVKLLRELCGSSLWSGDLEFLLFSEKSSEEIAFDYMTAERRRENFSHP